MVDTFLALTELKITKITEWVFGVPKKFFRSPRGGGSTPRPDPGATIGRKVYSIYEKKFRRSIGFREKPQDP